MEDCIFCKIVRGEIDSAKIWENEEFMAILDSNPNVKGMTLVIPKKHYDSDVFTMPNKEYEQFMLATKEVARFLRQGLEVKRVAMVMEGVSVNHAHLKLYPLFGLDEKFVETVSPQKIFFDNYPGYLSTQLGPSKDIVELKKLAQNIKNKNVSS
jgi:diadenosine tetraphosphate (Ap4A) HIT family hydrolase